MSALLRVKLSRPDSSTPWGFRLEGGFDLGRCLSVQRVAPGSLAEGSGLRPGDLIARINNIDTRFMTHEEAKMEIIRSSNDFDMIIERTDHIIINPTGAPLTLEPVARATTVNINANGGAMQASPVSSIEFIPTPPKAGEAMMVQGTGGRMQRLTHSSYNSPMGLYSRDNVKTSFKSTVLAAGAEPSQVRPAPQVFGGSMHCGSCGNIIAGGSFIRVQGRIPMHPECLKCCKCGIGLRNVGYFYINEKLYCETHAKQTARPPDHNLKPVVIYK